MGDDGYHCAAPSSSLSMAYVGSPLFSSCHSSSTVSIASSTQSSTGQPSSPSAAYPAGLDWQWLDAVNYQDDTARPTLMHSQHSTLQRYQSHGRPQSTSSPRMPSSGPFASQSLLSPPPLSTSSASPLPAALPAMFLPQSPVGFSQRERSDRQRYATVIGSPIHSGSVQQSQQLHRSYPQQSQPSSQQHSVVLPALPAPVILQSQSPPSSSSSSRHLAGRRRKLACSTCRHVKSECSGDRPCRRCIRLGKADTCADPTTPYPPKKPRTAKAGGTDSPTVLSPGGRNAVAAKRAAGRVADNRVKEEIGSPRDSGSAATGADSDATSEDAEDACLLRSPLLPTPPSSPSPGLVGEDESAHSGWLSASSYQQCVPVLAAMFSRQPAVVTPTSSTGLLYRMAHLFEMMPPNVFKTFMDLAGYVPDTPSLTPQHAAADAASQPSPMDLVLAPQSPRSPTSPTLSSMPAVAQQQRIRYRSPHVHLPAITLPHRFRFNWSLSPEVAFPDEGGLVQNFPTVLWYHYPPAAHWVFSDNGLIVPVPAPSFVNVGWTPSTPLQCARGNERPLLPHEIDLSLTEQYCILLCNTAAERLFGYSMRELKLAFTREGKQAFVRLFDASLQEAHDSDMRRYNAQGQTDFTHWVNIRTKFGSVLRVLMNRKLVVDQDGLVIVNRYTFISAPSELTDSADK